MASMWDNKTPEGFLPLPPRFPKEVKTQFHNNIACGLAAWAFSIAAGFGVKFFLLNGYSALQNSVVFFCFALLGGLAAFMIITRGRDTYQSKMMQYRDLESLVSFYYTLQPSGELVWSSITKREAEPNHSLLQVLVGTYVQEHHRTPPWILWATVKKEKKCVRLLRVVSIPSGFAFAEHALPITWEPGDWLFHEDRTMFSIDPLTLLQHAEVFAARSSIDEFVPYVLILLKSAQDDLRLAMEHGIQGLSPREPAPVKPEELAVSAA